MNKDYNEEGGSGLPQKVKGSKGEGANFKPFSNPDGVGDEQSQNINGGGVATPQESTKKLPQTGKTV